MSIKPTCKIQHHFYPSFTTNMGIIKSYEWGIFMYITIYKLEIGISITI